MLISIFLCNIVGCDTYTLSNNEDNNAKILKIYSGSYGFDVAYRIDED
jgi:hypothetical protein